MIRGQLGEQLLPHLWGVLHTVVPTTTQVSLHPFHVGWKLYVTIGTIVSGIEEDALWRAGVCLELYGDIPGVVVRTGRAAWVRPVQLNKNSLFEFSIIFGLIPEQMPGTWSA